jgi:hypothetical protein
VTNLWQIQEGKSQKGGEMNLVDGFGFRTRATAVRALAAGVALLAALLLVHPAASLANPVGFTPIPDDSVGNGPGTAAFGINDAGEIVGTANGDAFFYSGGSYLNFGVSGGQGNQANGINNHDQIVGSYEFSGTITGQAFAGTPGAVNPLVPPGSAEASATGINNAGVIVGGYDKTFHGPFNGFIDNGGLFTTFDVPGASQTVLSGINNKGDLAGYYISGNGLTGFSTDANHDIVLTVPGGIVKGINDFGQIAGYYNGESTGFVDTNGTITPISIDGASQTQVTGINDKGQIVGFYTNPNEHSFIATAPPPSILSALSPAEKAKAFALEKTLGFASLDTSLAFFSELLAVEGITGASKEHHN